ncbi:MAG TPA: M23 family metallopeptidase [Bacteroidales bacterium]|nr:M23 family metallopeptidase [Bacteroidales bacterium]HSA42956.1 M23 family metallopeptidase [Bacteroidales bacterium]
MAKARYHFNHKSLTFEKVNLKLKDRLIKLLSFLATAMVFSTVVIFIAYNFFSSPREKSLEREIAQYKLQYKILNDRMSHLTAVMNELQEKDDNIYRVIFEAEPIPSTVRNAAYGGSNRYAHLEGLKNTEVIVETAKKLDNLARRMYVQSISFDEVFNMARNKEEMMACLPAIVPVRGGTSRIVSGYGYRIHPIYKTMRMHWGIDFTAPKGTPVFATANGTVTIPDRASTTGYGITVLINHGFGYQTFYTHLSRTAVKPGQKVTRGQIIGYVGSTGLAVAPHLHYEVIKNGKKINPINFFFNDLSPEEYKKVLEIASRVTQSLS